jgi:hypothetical protein
MPRVSRGSPVGEALAWSARIMALGLMMFVPGVLGTWLDGRLQTRVFGPAGFILGVSLAIARLAMIGRRTADR